ncbi:hypothetical protein JW921_01695, partial [Candidatus Fermentibacterales bacterium]|nr:hypothetical protein [Candidatus Fermentibacterales bacterium]
MDWNSLPRETVPCTLCGSSTYRLLRRVRGYPVVRCSTCGLIYLRERPAEHALDRMYGSSYYDDGDIGYTGYVETFRRFGD